PVPARTPGWNGSSPTMSVTRRGSGPVKTATTKEGPREPEQGDSGVPGVPPPRRPGDHRTAVEGRVHSSRGQGPGRHGRRLGSSQRSPVPGAGDGRGDRLRGCHAPHHVGCPAEAGEQRMSRRLVAWVVVRGPLGRAFADPSL